MDLKQIRQIVELMEEHGLTVFHLEKKDFNIKLKKGSDLESVRELMGSVPMMPAAAAAPAAAPAPVAAPAPAPVAAVPAVPGSGNPQEDLFRQLFADIDSGQLDNNWYDNRLYQGQPSRSASFKRKTDSQVAYLTSKFPRADWIDEGLRARGLVA